MSKRSVFSALKWVFAVGLLVALVKSGKLSLADLSRFFQRPDLAFLCFVILIVQVMGTFYRWKMLLWSQGAKISYRETFKLGMLGQFFSTVVPGAVGGDLVKAVYVARAFPAKKVATVSTILVDRVCGLMGMTLLGATAFLAGYSSISNLPQKSALLVQGMGLALVVGAALVLGFLAALALWGKRLPDFKDKVFDSGAANKLLDLYRVFLSYRDHLNVLAKAIGVSTLLHCLNVLVLFVAAYAIFGAPPWGSLNAEFFIVAAILGLSSLAIPVAPAGLGVGQIAFAALFVAVGAPDANFGSAMITAQQVVGISINLCGAFFFATYKSEVHQAQAMS